MRLIPIATACLMLAACSGTASREDQLDAAADQSTPAAANVLEGAADNGMDANDAINAAAEAQAANSSINGAAAVGNAESNAQ